MQADSFGADFFWGISSSAYQTEGAFDADGKGPSIWDDFSSKPGRIFQNQHARTACDFYHRYPQDIGLIRQLGIPNFRFSLSWPRILPEGKGKVNQRGLDFYKRLIHHCLENQITPWVTLYHWDLPLALSEQGGWTHRDIVGWFGEYVEVCARELGDVVKHWMVLNEPLVFTGAGYFLGLHAPGKKGLLNFAPAVHHAALCQAEGGRILRDICPNAEIGTTFSCAYIEPFRQLRRDIGAAKRADALLNRLFIEPALGLSYPSDDLPILRKLEPYIQPGDLEKLVFDFDFIGLQNYTREVIRHSWITPYLYARPVSPLKRKVAVTEMKWEVYPEAIYRVLKQFHNKYGLKKIIITENGAAFPDHPSAGAVKDPLRQKYLQDHIAQCLRAQQEGVPLQGYFVWTLTDNFEWAEGYHPRFGLVYVDIDSQERIIKDSGKWYGKFVSERERISL
ncbi:MAG: GH1 family beta-glucosidase [Cyclobacteriaceae bacterium]